MGAVVADEATGTRVPERGIKGAVVARRGRAVTFVTRQRGSRSLDERERAHPDAEDNDESIRTRVHGMLHQFVRQ